MKQFLKDNWLKLTVLFFIIIAFVWFQVRPAIIFRACHLWGMDRAASVDGNRDDYEYQYSKCLRENGFNKEIYASVLH